MSDMLKNGNFLYTGCTGSMAYTHSHTIVASRAQCTSINFEYDGSINLYYEDDGYQTLPRMKVIVCRGDQGTTCSPESLRSNRIVSSTLTLRPSPLFDVDHY